MAEGTPTFFLTELDPRAAIKGSRDPLGLIPIWQRFGRSVVGNLTTVTTSVRGFTTLLLGLHFADQLIESGQADESDRANLFLKLEQLCAYSRQALRPEDLNDWEGILGITRVKRRLANSSSVTISAKQDYQILSNQKTYGLWGLYTMAARHSGLVESHENRLTPLACKFVEAEYLPRLSYAENRAGREIFRFLQREETTFYPKSSHKQLASALADLHRPELTTSEEELFDTRLVLGSGEDQNHTNGRQEAMWRALEALNDSGNFFWAEPFGYSELTEAVKQANTQEEYDLAEALDRIRSIEPVLAALASAYSFLLRRNQSTPSEAASEIRETWGRGLLHLEIDRIRELGPRLSEAAGAESSARILQMAEVLRSGDYEGLVDLLLKHNAAVMKARGGAAWISLDQGRLNVRLREESGELLPADELPDRWSNPYFLNSLKIVAARVKGKVS